MDPERPEHVRSPSSSASWLVTMCFVSWSAAIAASAIAASATHCIGPARERTLARTRRARARSSTSRRERRARRARLVVTRAPPAARRRCRATPTDTPRGAPARSPCRRARTCRRCRRRSASAPRRSRRGPARSSPRACSRSRGRASRSRCRRDGCRSPPEISSTSSSSVPGWLVAQIRDRALDALALLEQHRAEAVGVDAHGAGPFCSVGGGCGRKAALDERRPEPGQLDDLVPPRGPKRA